MKKFFYCSLVMVVITIAAVNLNLNSVQNGLMLMDAMNIEALANDENECSDDEKAEKLCVDCENGTNCECYACIKGSTDCTPTCPCC